MGELDAVGTILILLVGVPVGFGGLLIGLFVLIGILDRWITRLADRIVQRGERHRRALRELSRNG